jgi:hypothetical protein
LLCHASKTSYALTEKCSGTKPIRNLFVIFEVEVEKQADDFAPLAEAMTALSKGLRKHCIVLLAGNGISSLQVN